MSEVVKSTPSLEKSSQDLNRNIIIFFVVLAFIFGIYFLYKKYTKKDKPKKDKPEEDKFLVYLNKLKEKKGDVNFDDVQYLISTIGVNVPSCYTTKLDKMFYIVFYEFKKLAKKGEYIYCMMILLGMDKYNQKNDEIDSFTYNEKLKTITIIKDNSRIGRKGMTNTIENIIKDATKEIEKDDTFGIIFDINKCYLVSPHIVLSGNTTTQYKKISLTMRLLNTPLLNREKVDVNSLISSLMTIIGDTLPICINTLDKKKDYLFEYLFVKCMKDSKFEEALCISIFGMIVFSRDLNPIIYNENEETFFFPPSQNNGGDTIKNNLKLSSLKDKFSVSEIIDILSKDRPIYTNKILNSDPCA